MRTPRTDDFRIATEAARWQRELERGDAKSRAEFADWIKASPRHVREFMFMEALDAAAKNLDASIPIERNLGLTDDDRKVELLRSPTDVDEPHAPRWKTATLRLATAASVALVAIAVWLIPANSDGWDGYATDTGERRTFDLDDGSVLQLNTQSRIRVRYTPAGREVRLLAGEALFKVAHDPSRPFRVRTDDAVIRAVGTQFNVNRRTGGTTIAVVEGKVEVAPKIGMNSHVETPSSQAPGESRDQLLSAGEAARIEENVVVRTARITVAEATAWRQRRLVFNEETLAGIAEEFNRYNRVPQLIIEGEAARARRYGGTFDADDPEALIAFISRSGALDVTRRGERITVKERNASTTSQR